MTNGEQTVELAFCCLCSDDAGQVSLRGTAGSVDSFEAAAVGVHGSRAMGSQVFRGWSAWFGTSGRWLSFKTEEAFTLDLDSQGVTGACRPSPLMGQEAKAKAYKNLNGG